MKSLNYSALMKDALRSKISVYLVIKRALNYRKSKNWDCCENCKHRNIIDFWDEPRQQCQIIGESISKFSDIELDYVCKKFVASNNGRGSYENT